MGMSHLKIMGDPSFNMRLGRTITAYWAGPLCTNCYGENRLTGTWKLRDPLPLLMLPDPTAAKVSEWPHLCGSATGKFFSPYI